MSYSDIVGSISGLLQFVVACYALRVSRAFGIARVGWMFFGAFSMLALVHVLLSVHPFGINIDFGANVNFLYEIISVLLLGNIAQVETLLWKRRQQEKSVQRNQSEEETKIKELTAELEKAKAELQQTTARFQAELEQQKQTQGQTQDQAGSAGQLQLKAYEEQLKTSQEQLAAARQSGEEFQATATLLQAEVIQLKEAQGQTQEQTENAYQDQLKAYQEQLTVLRQSEAAWQSSVAELQAEVTQLKLAQDQVEKTHQGQLAVARQSEEALRTKVVGLQAEALEPKPDSQRVEQPVEHNQHDLLAILRQSGIAEVAAMAQSRVAYIARIIKLMRAHPKDLGKFMTRNHKGKHLPESLSLLVEYLADEQFLLLKRIDSLKLKFEQLTQTAAEHPNPDKVSSATETRSDDRETPNGNRSADKNGTVDFRDHLIANVTDTGTELVSIEEEAAGVEAVDVTVLDPNEAPARV